MVVPGERGFDGRDVDAAATSALRSQVACAALGLVIEKPSHGYEIAVRCEARFGAFVSMSQSAVYKALSRLMEAGLIETMPGASTTGVKRGPKAGPPYRATALGARAYRGLLAERVRSDPARTEMLGRMVLAGVRSVDAALDFLSHYQHGCFQEASELVLPGDDQVGAGGGSGVSGLVGRLLIDERRRKIDAELAWITYARAELRALRDSAAGGELP